jgi:hypothetical protein
VRDRLVEVEVAAEGSLILLVLTNIEGDQIEGLTHQRRNGPRI